MVRNGIEQRTGETPHTLSNVDLRVHLKTFSRLLAGSLQAKCVNSPLHFFQVKNAKENLEQFSTSLKMLEMFALELLTVEEIVATGALLFIYLYFSPLCHT